MTDELVHLETPSWGTRHSRTASEKILGKVIWSSANGPKQENRVGVKNGGKNVQRTPR